MNLDKKNYNITFDDNRVHEDSNRIGLAVRQWVESNNLDAFTMNFSKLEQQLRFSDNPFFGSKQGDGIRERLCG